MLGLTFSSKLDWGSYIISNSKTASKKIGALICSMKFLPTEVAQYHYEDYYILWRQKIILASSSVGTVV